MTPHPYAKRFRQALAGFTPPSSIRQWAEANETSHTTVSRVLSGARVKADVYAAITRFAKRYGP